MVYVVGAIGLILGFIAGQIILLRLLRNHSNKEILSEKNIIWIYGTFNWILAGTGAYAAVTIYNIYSQG